MTVKELINNLKQYPSDIRVSVTGLPFDDIELNIRHFESDNPKIDEFDYLSLD